MKMIDLQKQIATVTSAATITLGAVVDKFRTVAQAIAAGDLAVGDTSIPFFVRDPATGAWEAGLYTITSSTLLTREKVLSGSNGASAVAFGGASCEVYSAAPAAVVAQLSGARDIPFATAVPLTQVGTAFMPSQTVASVLAFSAAANPVRGALAFVRLVADGVNAPTFSGMKEWNGSSGYDNRNGIVNVVQFFCDGVDVWYSIAQAVGATPVAAKPGAPTIGAASAGDSTASVYFTAPSSNGGATITGYTITGYKASDNSVVNTITAAASPASFTGLTNGVGVYFKVAATNSAGTGPQSAASNTVTPSASSATYARLSNLTNMTESGAGPYNYAGDGNGSYGSSAIGGITTTSLQSGQDGSIAITIGGYSTSGGNEPMIGLLQPGWGMVGYATMPCAVYTQGSTNKYVPITNGNIGTPTNNVTVANGDIMRMRRAGSSIIAEVSKDGGSTWTVIFTWTGQSTGTSKFQVSAAKSSQALNLTGVGLA